MSRKGLGTSVAVANDADRSTLLDDEHAARVAGGRRHEHRTLEAPDSRERSERRTCRPEARVAAWRRLHGDADRALHPEARVAGHRAEEAERALARERHRDRLALPRTQNPRALLVRDHEVVRRDTAVAHDEPHRRAGRDAPSRQREGEVACVDRDRERAGCRGRCAAGEHDGSERGRRRGDQSSRERRVACHPPEASLGGPSEGWSLTDS